MNEFIDFFSAITDTSDFPPRWHCGKWTSFHGWLYIVSNITIWLAYFSIPAALMFITYKKALPFKNLIILFSAFIIACGTTHLVEAIIFWEPIYRINALILFGTAVISTITVYVLVKKIPVLLSYKNPTELDKEIKQRKAVEKQLETFLLKTPAAIAVFDTNMCYLNASERWYKDYNLVGQEIIGKSHYDVFPEIKENKTWLDHHQACLKGETIKKELDEFKKADGTTEYLKWELLPWTNADNSIGGVIMLTEVITEQIKQQEALINNEKRYNLAIKGTSAGIWDWIDINKKEEWWSPKFYELIGYENNEIEASLDSFSSLLHPDDSEATFNAVNEHMKRNVPFRKEFRLKTKKDGYKWFLSTGQVDRDDLGNPTRMVGSITNIHEKKIAEQELEAFTYSVSHDLRAPLRGIHGLSNMLLEDYEDSLDENAIKTLKRIAKNSTKMGLLIDDLLNFSKMSSVSLSIKKIDTNHFIRDIIWEMEDQTNLNFIDHIDLHHLPTIYGDKTFLTLVIKNILENALKYKKKDNTLKIVIDSTETEKNTILSFKDNGIGFNMNYHDKIFGVFERLEDSSEYSGTGIGLAIVQKILKKHKGKVWAESEEGKGSTFYISLPKL